MVVQLTTTLWSFLLPGLVEFHLIHTWPNTHPTQEDISADLWCSFSVYLFSFLELISSTPSHLGLLSLPYLAKLLDYACDFQMEIASQHKSRVTLRLSSLIFSLGNYSFTWLISQCLKVVVILSRLEVEVFSS